MKVSHDEHHMYKKLFEPLKINKTTIKNRIVYPSLALSYSDDRKLNERYLEYYREKAKGAPRDYRPRTTEP